jgi:hypothetical protein
MPLLYRPHKVRIVHLCVLLCVRSVPGGFLSVNRKLDVLASVRTHGRQRT